MAPAPTTVTLRISMVFSLLPGGVIIEAAAGLLAQPARRHHLAQHPAWQVLLPVSYRRLQRGDDVVPADFVSEFKWAERPVEAELLYAVDIIPGGKAALQHDGCLVDH